MHFNRPVIKRTLPIYRLDNSVFRIGAQLGTTSEFTDPKCEMWDLVQSLNGSEWQTIVKRMKDMHPRLSEKDIEKRPFGFGQAGICRRDVRRHCHRPALYGKCYLFFLFPWRKYRVRGSDTE